MEAVLSLEEIQPAIVAPPDNRPDWHLGPMIGRSPAIQRLFSQMRHTARHLRVAVIEGESGTGKMLAARTLHEFSSGPQSAFVPCTAEQLFESLPAAYEAKNDFSAFPILRQSREGTLVLTRVDELLNAHQAQILVLLEWIEHQHIRRSLDSIPQRILCLSSRPLRKLASTGALRPDLFNRLNAIRFALPALRERREDIQPLADHFAQQFSLTHEKHVRGIMPQVLPRLAQHLWPGNVRELESVIYAASLACPGQWIRPIDLPAFNTPIEAPPAPFAAPPDTDPNLDRAILRHIKNVLSRADGNKLRAAKMLGISRSTLYRLLESASI